MKILLIFPKVKFLNKPGDRPPLGIAYLASYLRRYIKDVDITIIDFNLYPDMNRDEEIELVSSKKPDLVGLSFLTPAFQDAQEIANSIRHKLSSRIILVAGGPHASAAPKETLQGSDFDFAVRGEGEKTFFELVQALSKGGVTDKIRGISFKHNGKIVHTADRPLIKELDSIPFPAHDLLEIDKYSMKIEGRSAMPILSSRGCPYQCIYCSKKVFGSNFRRRSAHSVLEEIKFVKAKYNISAFLFVDDTFTISPSRLNEFCNLVKQEGLEIRWRCWTRSDCVTKELLKNMYSAGCRIVCFGAESGNQGVLDIIRKGLRVEENRNAIRWAKEAGLKVKLFVMVGLPGEGRDEVEDTINFVLDTDPHTVDCYVTTPYPYTALWDDASKYGVRISSFNWRDYYYAGKDGNVPVLLRTDILSEDDIQQLYRRMRTKLKRYTCE